MPVVKCLEGRAIRQVNYNDEGKFIGQDYYLECGEGEAYELGELAERFLNCSKLVEKTPYFSIYQSQHKVRLTMEILSKSAD
jgi:hypothetical protein